MFPSNSEQVSSLGLNQNIFIRKLSLCFKISFSTPIWVGIKISKWSLLPANDFIFTAEGRLKLFNRWDGRGKPKQGYSSTFFHHKRQFFSRIKKEGLFEGKFSLFNSNIFMPQHLNLVLIYRVSSFFITTGDWKVISESF